MIGQMSTRADKRLGSLTHVPIQCYIIEKYACRRLADGPHLFESWPTRFAVPHFAISLGVRRLWGSGLVDWRVEVLLIPELCAERSSWYICTWLKRSTGISPWYSTMARSGPCRYANPAPPRGSTPLALASAICALVSPKIPPVPGQVSLLMNTAPPSSVV